MNQVFLSGSKWANYCILVCNKYPESSFTSQFLGAHFQRSSFWCTSVYATLNRRFFCLELPWEQNVWWFCLYSISLLRDFVVFSTQFWNYISNGWRHTHFHTSATAFKGHIVVRLPKSYQKWPKSSQKGQKRSLMKVEMTQLYLCEEPYWSKYDQSDLSDHPLEINVISDGKYFPGKC